MKKLLLKLTDEEFKKLKKAKKIHDIKYNTTTTYPIFIIRELTKGVSVKYNMRKIQ